MYSQDNNKYNLNFRTLLFQNIIVMLFMIISGKLIVLITSCGISLVVLRFFKEYKAFIKFSIFLLRC